MIIGTCTNEYSRWGEEKFKKMREHGDLAVDYDIDNTDNIPYTLNDAEAEAFLLAEKQRIEDAGLIISQTHGPWRWPACDKTEEDRAERMEKMKRSLKFCSILGCKYWVIHPIMPFGTEEKNDSEKAQMTWDMNIEFMSELLKTAKEYGIVICLENMPMPHFSLGSPQNILKFVKEIDDDNFKICFDTGHATMFNYKSVGDHIRELGVYIKVFHIHDNNGWADLHQIPFFGVIDWEDFSKSLKDINFDGVFSMEANSHPNLPDSEFEILCNMKHRMIEKILNM